MRSVRIRHEWPRVESATSGEERKCGNSQETSHVLYSSWKPSVEVTGTRPQTREQGAALPARQGYTARLGVFRDLIVKTFSLQRKPLWRSSWLSIAT